MLERWARSPFGTQQQIHFPTVLDAFVKEKLVLKVFKAQHWNQKMGEFVKKFELNRSDLQFALILNTSQNVNTIGQNVNAIGRNVEAIGQNADAACVKCLYLVLSS